jgi:prepilin-type N-terminal cleavage/methylation domain-containing protein
MLDDGHAETVRAKTDAGFTLIELSIVILIISIVARMTIPQMRSIVGAELTAATRRLANTTRYLYEEAALRGTVLDLYFDLDRQEYWVAYVDDETGALVEAADVLGRRVRLPRDVRIVDVIVPGVGKVADGVVPTRFYPEGYADRSVIHVADEEGHSYTLRIDPIRGRAEVSEGYEDLDVGAVS